MYFVFKAPVNDAEEALGNSYKVLKSPHRYGDSARLDCSSRGSSATGDSEFHGAVEDVIQGADNPIQVAHLE
jgi:hypothetical protein